MVRGAGGRRGAAGGRRRGAAGAIGGHGVGLPGDGAPAVPVGGDGRGPGPAADARVQGPVVNQKHYDRSLERFTWNRVLRSHTKRNKRSKVLSKPKDRDKKVSGSCVFCSIATALEAGNRICGVQVDELSWEELYEMVGPDNPLRITAALRVLKYRGIRRRVDYQKRNFNAKKFKISQFVEFCNTNLIDDDVPCGLDRNNIKAAIDNMLSKTVMLAYFPISASYLELLDGGESIYAYNKDEALLDGGSGAICTHLAVVTGFGFEESIPYFEFLDSNGKEFGKNGYGRILPSSIFSLYAFDIIVD